MVLPEAVRSSTVLHEAVRGRPVLREAVRGRPVLNLRYGKVPSLAIHRAGLFDALWQAVTARPVTLVTGTRITGAAPGWLQAGTARIGPFDLIVDALGAGSALSPLRARPLPYRAIWGTVDWSAATDLPRDELRQCYFAIPVRQPFTAADPRPPAHPAQPGPAGRSDP